MADFHHDQAEGLRRLLERAQMRVVTVASGCHGVGQTSAVINIAAAMAALGTRVLVIDENYGPSNVAGLLGMRPRYELQHVMRATCTLEAALLAGPHGVTLLSAANGGHAVPNLRQPEQDRLRAACGLLGGRFDVVLVDTPCSNGGTPGLFGRAIQDTIIVSSAAASAITASYALIKQLRGPVGGRRFYILLNRVACERNARVVMKNIKTVVNGHLATPLGCLGSVPEDASTRRAARGFQPVVAAFPSAPAALGFRRVAADIAAWPREHEPRHGLDGLMQRLLGGSHFTFDYAGV